ncbi:MAG: OmpA family protein [Deltaproteobacteria bacterium]|nr:OmpA family protein [Deltaproteobacteria bacterium]
MILRLASLLSCCLVAGILPGCAGGELEGRASAIRRVIKNARDNGAYKCAPRELALAVSHADFAEQELSDGDYYRARQELAIADENARLAVDKSPREKCNPKLAIADPPKEVVIKRLDSDGDGLHDDEDGCPNEPEDKDNFQDDDGCPEPDNDVDGIVDASDTCPLVPEDKDDFQDEDGCPEDDNDSDGLADAIDQCPNEAEDKDGFQDDDGCPDADNDGDKVVDFPTPSDKCPDQYAETPDGCPQKYQLIVITPQKIELKQTIYFDFRKATIKPISYPLLNEVAAALKDHATIRVRIEGHTDSRGSRKFNMKLSQARAEAVRAYLGAHGIQGDRMNPVGFGPTIPIADNRTQAGRDQNRRVEFVITSQ